MGAYGIKMVNWRNHSCNCYRPIFIVVLSGLVVFANVDCVWENGCVRDTIGYDDL